MYVKYTITLPQPFWDKVENFRLKISILYWSQIIIESVELIVELISVVYCGFL